MIKFQVLICLNIVWRSRIGNNGKVVYLGVEMRFWTIALGLWPRATVPKSSFSPRDNSFDCSTNAKEIFVYCLYVFSRVLISINCLRQHRE